MKLKLGHWEFDFDAEDAKVVFPLILLLLALTLTQLRKDWLLAGAVGYYLLYFFLPPCVRAVGELFAKLHHWWTFKCPNCKSREVILQGYQGYNSDEQYAHYLCNRCRKTTVLVNDKLIKTGRDRLPAPDRE